MDEGGLSQYDRGWIGAAVQRTGGGCRIDWAGLGAFSLFFSAPPLPLKCTLLPPPTREAQELRKGSRKEPQFAAAGCGSDSEINVERKGKKATTMDETEERRGDEEKEQQLPG